MKYILVILCSIAKIFRIALKIHELALVNFMEPTFRLPVLTPECTVILLSAAQNIPTHMFTGNESGNFIAKYRSKPRTFRHPSL